MSIHHLMPWNEINQGVIVAVSRNGCSACQKAGRVYRLQLRLQSLQGEKHFSTVYNYRPSFLVLNHKKMTVFKRLLGRRP